MLREIKFSLLKCEEVLTNALALLQLLTFVYTGLDLYMYAVPIYTGVSMLTCMKVFVQRNTMMHMTK